MAGHYHLESKQVTVSFIAVIAALARLASLRKEVIVFILLAMVGYNGDI